MQILSFLTLLIGTTLAQPLSTSTIINNHAAYYLPLTPDSTLPSTSFTSQTSPLSWTPITPAQALQGLFISAHIHTGTTIETIIELFNPSSETVSTDGYAILVSKAYSGISRTWQDNAVLQYDLPSTTIAPYGSYVLCHEANNNPRCDAKLRSNGVPSKTFNIRGNDAVALIHGSTVLDEIGQVTDAMSRIDGWTIGSDMATFQRTMYRERFVYHGTTWDISSTTGQWKLAPNGDVSELQQHPFDGKPTFDVVKPTVLAITSDVTDLGLNADIIIPRASRYITTIAIMIPDTADVNKLSLLQFQAIATNPVSNVATAFDLININVEDQTSWPRNAFQYINLHDATNFTASTRIQIAIATPKTLMSVVSSYIFDSVVVYDASLPAPRHAGASDTTTVPTTEAPTTETPTTTVPTTEAPTTITPPTDEPVIEPLPGIISIQQPRSGATDVQLTTTVVFTVSKAPTNIDLYYVYHINTDAEKRFLLISAAANDGSNIVKSFDIQVNPGANTLYLDIFTANNVTVGIHMERSFTAVAVLFAPTEIGILATPTNATLTWTDRNTLDINSITYAAEMRIQNDDNTFGTWTPIPSSAITRDQRSYTIKLGGLSAATLYHVSIRALAPASSSARASVSFRTDGFIRRPGSQLTSTEKAAYVRALKDLGNSGAYHVMTLQHDVAINTQYRAHQGPIFAPWHRLFLHRLEAAMKTKLNPTEYASHFGITFWDWERAASTEAQFRSVFTDDFMGGDGSGFQQKVATGPFISCIGRSSRTCDASNDWDTYVVSSRQPSPFNPSTKTNTGLTRRMGRNVRWTQIATRSQIDRAYATDMTFLQFSQTLESWHNSVHNYVGGDMLGGTSPNDPVFYQHHCNVDKLWWEFQVKQPNVLYDPNPNQANATGGYAYTSGQRWSSKMIYQDDKQELNEIPISEMMDGNAMGTRYVMTWNPEWSRDVRISGAIAVPRVATWTISPADATLSSGSTFTAATISTKLTNTYQAWTDLKLDVTITSATDLYFLQFLNNAGEVIAFTSAVATTSPTTTSLTLSIASSHRSLGDSITIAMRSQGTISVSTVTLRSTPTTIIQQTGLAMATQSTGTAVWFARTSEIEGKNDDLVIPTSTSSSSSIPTGAIVGIIVGALVLMTITAITGYIIGTRRASTVADTRMKMFQSHETQAWSSNPAIAMQTV